MSKPVIVIDCQPNRFCAVEVRGKNNRAELVRFVLRDLPPGEMTPDRLRELWQQANFTKRRVILVLPNRWVKYRTIRVPDLPGPQRKAAVRMELESGGDGREKFLIVHHRVLDGLAQVRVALLRDDLLQAQVQLLERSGLKVCWSGLRNQGIRSFLHFHRGFLNDSNQAEAYLDLADERAEFGVVEGEELTYWRDFRAENLPRDEALADLLEEFRLSLAAYRAETGKPFPPKVWFLGNDASLPDLPDKLKAEFGIELYRPGQSCLGGVLPGRHTAGLAPLLGLALEQIAGPRRNGPEETRILSSKQESALNQRRTLRIAGQFGISLLILALGLGFGWQASREKRARMNSWLQARLPRIQNIRQAEQRFRRNEAKVRALEKWLAAQGRELDFLLLLQQNLPPESRITDLMIENGVVKELAGSTPSVSRLLEALQRVPALRGLRLKGTITRDADVEWFHLEGIIAERGPQP
ncbi:hypothetical protein EDC14_10635 [Hydrogenispora ethanolica]|uniref:Tfp pilus assembly PilM family ATPase n=1 Tax=Hydrogenispora ethanolica TaxID=1082276 RepID=A0A4R1QLB2_HYDET|nr:hypothetical protein [Hydrogenispora ethanolica]TCL54488.1 hypothetical protein EDC14_10635 [Hydrogenispora ethanolica]